MSNREVLTNYVRRMTSTLIQAGVKSVVISPGSRSTPLAYAFASSLELTMYRQIDERSAGYFALGLAKSSKEPVVLLCTSGTAASNYYPAVTEAHYARIPLIVITADRPHELREVGAPQTIDQIRMYGNHVKFSVDLPLADKHRDVEEFIEMHVTRGLSVAMTAPKGPIHFNVPFREPLLIDLESDYPKTTFQQRIIQSNCLDSKAEELVSSLLSKSEKGIIIAGEFSEKIDIDKFWGFAESLNWPVLCDPLSNLRANVPAHLLALCIDQYDAILKSHPFGVKVLPDTVVRFGAQPVSKSLALYLKKACPNVYIAVDDTPEFRDSLNLVTHHIQSSSEALFPIRIDSKKSAYSEYWAKANEVASEIVAQEVDHVEYEGAYVQLLFRHLPDGSDLISGSSMPIRDVDTFFRKTMKDVNIFANRGANGIDGVVSTALGIQAANNRPAWLLIGDLSFLHDVNGLIATRFHETDLTIIIMNNDGGGIFSYLPQAESPTYFEDLFGTPTGLTFEHIANMYDAQYAAVRTGAQFELELKQKKEKNLRIIEVFTDRDINVQAHRELWSRVTAGLESNE